MPDRPAVLSVGCLFLVCAGCDGTAGGGDQLLSEYNSRYTAASQQSGAGTSPSVEPPAQDLCVSKCPNDPRPDSSQLNSCHSLFASSAKCRTQATALYKCILSHQTCGSDGKSLPLASGSTCSSEISAYGACLSQ
jgi:hypothetical protein